MAGFETASIGLLASVSQAVWGCKRRRVFEAGLKGGAEAKSGPYAVSPAPLLSLQVEINLIPNTFFLPALSSFLKKAGTGAAKATKKAAKGTASTWWPVALLVCFISISASLAVWPVANGDDTSSANKNADNAVLLIQ
jgi:hypothetical protein